jgi:hypothetical protein
MGHAARAPGLRAGAGAWLMLCGAVLSGCGGDRHSAELMPLRLLHAPPVGQLSTEELRSLSMDCGKYPQKGTMRGRYDAAYCDAAMAAWSDSPLQMVTLPVAPTAAPAVRSTGP